MLLIFAAVSAPAWFDRDKTGFTDPALDESILGLLTALLVPVQLLLIAFSMSGVPAGLERRGRAPRGAAAGAHRSRGPAPAAA